ncbi:MAG TPA: aminotransferase class I/II-fold pyridoxal phosphate-dependent enzyme, partial [Blastocatellia bacterium]
MINTQTSLETQVPFYRPEITGNEVEEVTSALKSGWLTSGPRVRRFEREFADAVGASHALAVNSCTAALHLAVNALELEPGMAVLVPTMTFAATAAVVRYHGAVPILVDCDPVTFNMSLDDAARKLSRFRDDKPPGGAPKGAQAVGMIPVHVGGLMMDMEEVNRF